MMKQSSPKERLQPIAAKQHQQLHTVLKARQAAKIKQLGEALIAAGFCSLDEQAKVLGLSRSTTWTILKANHKSSGLSASIINRMLAAPNLPPRVKLTIVEYVEEKQAGLYGGGNHRVRKFAERIGRSIEAVRPVK